MLILTGGCFIGNEALTLKVPCLESWSLAAKIVGRMKRKEIWNNMFVSSYHDSNVTTTENVETISSVQISLTPVFRVGNGVNFLLLENITVKFCALRNHSEQVKFNWSFTIDSLNF